MRISARPSRRHDAWSHRGISEAEPFGLNAEPVLAGEILAKWSGVEAQIEAESQVLARCRGGAFWCPRAAQHFLAIVDEDRERNGRARIGVINREINLSIVATTDLAQWGVADRWSAPLETFTTERGDCEDYAIAKYVALSATGVSQQDIRLVVVRDNAARKSHAVVAVRLDGDWVILDNRWLALLRDREMWRATPLFELDGNGADRHGCASELRLVLAPVAPAKASVTSSRPHTRRPNLGPAGACGKVLSALHTCRRGRKDRNHWRICGSAQSALPRRPTAECGKT